MVINKNEVNGKWFVNVNPKKNATMRLFCFPYAGGGASIYREWNSLFPDSIEVCAIQYPGRENRINEAPIDDFLSLVNEICDNIHVMLDKPFAIFGHSLGAKVAFETAKMIMKRYHRKPICLFEAGSRAPFLQDKYLLHNLSEEDFIMSLHRYHGTPIEVLENEDIMSAFLPMLKADFSIEETFLTSKEEKMNCPLFVLAAEKDEIVSIEEALQWETLAKHDYEFVKFQGDHFFIKSEQRKLIHYIMNKMLQYEPVYLKKNETD